MAIDKDSGENGRITYSLQMSRGKNKKFRIDADSGIVYAAKTFEADTEYELKVKAEDNGSPKQMQTARVSIAVVKIPDISDHAPQMKIPDQQVDVTESDSPGFLVALMQATDVDNDRLWFDIVGKYIHFLFHTSLIYFLEKI